MSFTIVLPIYGHSPWLGEAINSVVAQTYQNWELIFWDNQSTDSSAEIVKSYNDPRFHYFYAPQHTLLYEARNYAIQKSKGEFLAFLDVDDWWENDKLEKQISFSNNALSELIDLPNQQGRSYQRSAITNQQERYVSLILGYISKMMEASDVTSEMVQIKPNDREYLGDISYSDDKKTEDQKYSIMKNIIDEIKS